MTLRSRPLSGQSEREDPVLRDVTREAGPWAFNSPMWLTPFESVNVNAQRTSNLPHVSRDTCRLSRLPCPEPSTATRRDWPEYTWYRVRGARSRFLLYKTCQHGWPMNLRRIKAFCVVDTRLRASPFTAFAFCARTTSEIEIARLV